MVIMVPRAGVEPATYRLGALNGPSAIFILYHSSPLFVIVKS